MTHTDQKLQDLIQVVQQLAQQLHSSQLDISKLYDLFLSFQTTQRQHLHPNPLNRFGKRCFSQSDEDGITLEIIRRLQLDKGKFIEVGVGDGRENNTLLLAALGWRGVWVGGEALSFELPANSRLKFLNTWVNRENLLDIFSEGLQFLEGGPVDLLSLDLDGNDFYLIERLLQSGVRPKVFIVEYNAKFPPPVEFCIAYDPMHTWEGTDYFGASLTTFTKLFNQFDYTLVCCNSHSGANAFYVHNQFIGLFADVPTRIEDLYVEPNYFLANRYGHPVSAKTLQTIFSQP